MSKRTIMIGYFVSNPGDKLLVKGLHKNPRSTSVELSVIQGQKRSGAYVEINPMEGAAAVVQLRQYADALEKQLADDAAVVATPPVTPAPAPHAPITPHTPHAAPAAVVTPAPAPAPVVEAPHVEVAPPTGETKEPA